MLRYHVLGHMEGIVCHSNMFAVFTNGLRGHSNMFEGHGEMLGCLIQGYVCYVKGFTGHTNMCSCVIIMFDVEGFVCHPSMFDVHIKDV